MAKARPLGIVGRTNIPVTALSVGAGVFDLDDPQADLIRIADVALSLSHLCRFGGHVKEAHETYSVAQHSVTVALEVLRRLADQGRHAPRDAELDRRRTLAALLHDAHEAYLGDITSPVKVVTRRSGPAFDDLKDRLDRLIATRFGLCCFAFRDFLIQDADLAVMDAERAAVHVNPNAWRVYPDCAYGGPAIVPVGPEEARRRFLTMFKALTADD